MNAKYEGMIITQLEDLRELGLTNQEIADEVGMHIQTVRKYIGEQPLKKDLNSEPRYGNPVTNHTLYKEIKRTFEGFGTVYVIHKVCVESFNEITGEDIFIDDGYCIDEQPFTIGILKSAEQINKTIFIGKDAKLRANEVLNILNEQFNNKN